MHLAGRARADRPHFEFINRGVDGALPEAQPYRQGQNGAGLGQPFVLTFQVANVLVAKLFRADRPRLAMTGNDQVGEGDTVGGGEQGVAARLVDEEVDEFLPLDVLLGLAERFPLLGRLRKRDDFISSSCVKSCVYTSTSGPVTARNGGRAIS